MANLGGSRGLVQAEFEISGEVQKTDGSLYVAVISKTKAEWAAIPQYMSKNRVLYVYSDYRQEFDTTTGKVINIPGVKIGDGVSYVIDLPFMTEPVTQADIDRWNNNNGLNARVDEENHNLIFFYGTEE